VCRHAIATVISRNGFAISSGERMNPMIAD
jgi:hypothetical protein